MLYAYVVLVLFRVVVDVFFVELAHSVIVVTECGIGVAASGGPPLFGSVVILQEEKIVINDESLP